jgi:hypothetical protein
MAINRFSQSTAQEAFPKFTNLWDGTTATSSFDSLGAVVVGAAGQASVTFSSIPQTYTHIFLRILAQSNRGTFGMDQLRVQVGSSNTIDSGSTSYSWHYIRGESSSVSVLAYPTSSGDNTSWQINGAIGTTTSGHFGVVLIDILEYTKTNKYKTLKSISGTEYNGALGGANARTAIGSSAWLGTNGLNAINTIRLLPENGSLFTQNSSFALYGVK